MLLQITGKTFEDAKTVANFNGMRIRVIKKDGVIIELNNTDLVQRRVLVELEDDIVVSAKVG